MSSIKNQPKMSSSVNVSPFKRESTNGTYGEFYSERKHSLHICIQPQLMKLIEYVDECHGKFKHDLADFVRLCTVPSLKSNANDKPLCTATKLAREWLARLGFKAKCYDVGFHDSSNRKLKLHLPPAILATYTKNPKLKTIMVYGFLDVTDADPSKWDTDPWSLTEKDKKLYGRGTAGGKGQLMMWFHAIESFLATNQELPVNIKFLIECMHESRSRGLETFLETRKQDFLLNLDYVVMCQSEWIGPDRPCLVFGSVGILNFTITVEKTESSSTYPLEDLRKIFATMVDEEENIIIPNFHHNVADTTPDEEELYESVDFDVETIRNKLPPYRQSWNKLKVLMHFWRMPSIAMEPLEVPENADDTGPIVLTKKFTIKIVQKQMPDKINSLVEEHIKKVCQDMKIVNKVSCEMKSSSRPWLQNYKNDSYEAARRAFVQIYRLEPNMIREDKDNLQINILQKLIEKPYLKLPLVNNESNPNGDNENISIKNYFEGTKVLAAFMLQLPLVAKRRSS